VPPGVVNIVCGPGQKTGATLVEHPEVAHITFTGSVETPFGGTKNSGFGREKGPEGLKAYYHVKTVTARL